MLLLLFIRMEPQIVGKHKIKHRALYFCTRTMKKMQYRL